MHHTTKTVKIPHVMLTERYPRAVAFASAIHATQTRKGEGNTTAYISHLLAVSALVLEAGGDEDQAIAGLLHDAAEDAGGEARLADIRARFGDDVADMVKACSDSTDDEWKKATPYWDRKQAYLGHLEKADTRAVLVSIADKVHNARAIVSDLRINHARDSREYLDEKFNGTPDEILTYYEECLRIGKEKGIPKALTVPLDDAVTIIKQSIGAGAG